MPRAPVLVFLSLLSPLVIGFSHKLFPSKTAFPASAWSSSRVILQSHGPERHELHDVTGISRRSILASLTGALPLILASSESSTANAADSATAADASVTHKVFMDVRVSRSDGTFYVRDDLPDTPENTVFYSRLIFGLFGKSAPQHVQQFLNYVDVNTSPLDDNPLPSYGRSSFRSLDQATGLLMGGYIPSLEVTSIGGGTALQYGGRILPAPLWVEKESSEKISHSTKGLLTHRTLEVLPTFGITTRSCPELDSTHFVFGKVLLDESSKQFLNVVEDIPTYSVDRPPALEETAVDDVAKSVFNAQREFFRGAAKTFGDTRIDKVYQGKLLRRVEVTQVGLL